MSTEIENKGEIYGLMATVLSEVGSISKNRSNQQQNYKFRGIDDVYEAVHPLFAKYKIFTIPRILSKETTERITASGTVLRFVEISMAYDFFAPDGSHVTAEVVGEAMDAGDKASNKAMSAAQKYALIQTLCIPTGDTPDADYTTHPEITGEVRQVSKTPAASSAPSCPDCGGPMWDNRETKKGKQPDYRCKNKDGCGKAVWLDKSEPSSNGFSDDQVLRDQLFVQAEKLLAGLPEARRKDALGRLAMLPTAQMAEKVNELAENARSKSSQPAPVLEMNRELKIGDILRDARPDIISDYLKDNFEGRLIVELTNAEIDAMHQDLTVPF